MGIRGKMWRVFAGILPLHDHSLGISDRRTKPLWSIMTSNVQFNGMRSPDFNALQSVRQGSVMGP